jgi:hypothetical protein
MLYTCERCSNPQPRHPSGYLLTRQQPHGLLFGPRSVPRSFLKDFGEARTDDDDCTQCCDDCFDVPQTLLLLSF